MSVKGFQETIRQMQAVAERTKNLRPALIPLAAEAEQNVDDCFTQQRDQTGRPWAPLKPATLAAKAARGQPADILIATGKLRDSAQVTAGFQQMTWTMKQPYAVFHESGTARMPARRMLPFINNSKIESGGSPGGKFWAKVERSIKKYIEEGVIPT